MLKIIKIFFLILIAVALCGVGSYLLFNNWYNKGIETRVSDSSEKTEFEVQLGEDSDSVASRLEESELIQSKLVFKLYLRFEGKGSNIQAGDFFISKNLTIPEIVEVLSNAKKLNTISLTVIPGYRGSEIVLDWEKAAQAKGGTQFTKDEFNVIFNDPDSINFSPEVRTFLDEVKPTGNSLEGFLYPETYEFEIDTSTQLIMEKFIEGFMEKTQGIPRNGDFYGNLILASIIQTESMTKEERPTISSVFHNRLEIGMALESDATVNFVTGKKDAQISFADQKIDSKYNTYKYPGLPLGPISSPTINSIEAAINPADTDYYFFLHEQDGTGQVHFGKTLSEHNTNRSKYLD